MKNHSTTEIGAGFMLERMLPRLKKRFHSWLESFEIVYIHHSISIRLCDGIITSQLT